MTKWQQTTLGKVLSSGGGKIQTGPFGSQLHASDYVATGIPCIMPANMKSNRVDLSGIAFIAEKDAKRLSHHLVQAGDIVYSRRGDVTQKALIREAEAGYFCGTGCLLVRPGDAIDSEFLTYHLSTPTNQDWIVKQAVGATMPNLNTAILSAVPLNVPPNKETQRKVAAVLSALDAKIDCNNRINAELEAMSKMLYDYWFVQFDFPDANGKPYKSSGGKMVYNATLKRKIPKGWKDGVASDLFDFNPTLSLSINTEASYIDMASLPVTGFMTDAPQRKPFAGGMKFQNGDVVVARITPCLENGKSALITLLKDREIGFGSTEFIVIRGKKVALGSFAAQLSRSASFRQFAISNMTGTSGRKRIDANTLETFSLPLPPDDILLKYEQVAHSCFEQMTLNAKENQHLAELRDWLLPLLMNGQVTVA